MGRSSISTAGASFFSKRKEGAGTRLPPVEDCGAYTPLLAYTCVLSLSVCSGLDRL
jgi:hypothetical protein